MATHPLARLLPEAPRALLHILDGNRGPVLAPVRAELYGAERFAQHARSLAESQRAEPGNWRSMNFFPRLRHNIVALREAHQYIGVQAESGYDISPAGEWLLDNFHLIEAQLKAIHEGLPRRYYRHLPLLQDAPLAGLPRVYGLAWAFVAHTDGAFDDELAQRFLTAYQQARELQLAELWALPTTMRVVLIENLRRLAERVATNKAARELANLCSDRLHTYSIESLDELLAELNRRGVGRTFLGQMAQRLHDLQRTSDPLALLPYQHWLQAALPDLASLRAQQAADQAADNLSVSNAVTSLRTISDADWPDIICNSSPLMQLMLGSPWFTAEHSATRDQTLHGIERLARRSGKKESEVARTLLGLMRNAGSQHPDRAVAQHWLEGPGRRDLLRALDLRESSGTATLALLQRWALPLYLGSLLLMVSGVAWLMVSQAAVPASGRSLSLGFSVLAGLLMLLPASEAVVAVINRLVSESVRPQHLPRLAFNEGLPATHRVMVVIPCMLTSESHTTTLLHRLRLHHLANPEPHVQFALLSDWADADAAHMPTDLPLLRDAVVQLRELNQQHPVAADQPPRFVVLHRERAFSDTEQSWIGWERKRGKLEQLIAALAQGTRGPFHDLGRESQIADDTRYVLTLDSDTQLPPGRLRELAGVAAHPHNQPQIDDATQRVVKGYGIFQPRIATPLPSPREVTPFHWLFAGQPGIDPYSAPSSEIYQDLFGEGTYTGKALLHVQTLHAVLHERLPEGLVLSHDLIEGSIARCAAVTDLAVIEDAPFHADAAAARVHRWARGDWQLLPIFTSPRLYPLLAVNRWKMFDNLRRSLVAPASLALLVLVLAKPVVSPLAALALVLAAFGAGPLLGAIAGFSPSRDDIALRHFYRGAALNLTRAVLGALWHMAQLLQHAGSSADAIVRSLHRMFVSRRKLMQWTTAAASQAAAETSLPRLVQRHWQAPLLSAVLLLALLAARTPHPWLAAALCALWAATPVWTWWVSRPRPDREDQALPAADQARLERIARDTWRLFERCVGPQERHLPPDNLQTVPHDMVAHRTSPTNIGLYLLSACCARAFGWVGTLDLVDRLEATLGTLDTLQRYRGHFLNWYDTESGATLQPQYVSAVDSGNLCGHLLAVAQACRDRARHPFDDTAAQRAAHASRARLTPLLRLMPELFPDGDPVSSRPLARLLSMPSPLDEAQHNRANFRQLLHDAREEARAGVPETTGPAAHGRTTLRDELSWQLADHLATLQSALRDAEGSAGEDALRHRLLAVAERCERLAWSADFSFLYHRKRQLFHIGFRVTEQQLDAGFYDLLASEARLTSLLAIAKGDVPVNHWASLGRPFYAVGAQAGLRSWSGSMFEYLMPSLVLDEPHGSVLRDASIGAVHEQMAYARAHGVPWGISESAYAGRDHTLAYQYAPQGVPRLAFRRTSTEELVIAPYATALAAQVSPRRAAANLHALEALGARARYGYIEALDFTPARLAAGEPYAPVVTFMAHHQGMSIVAIANVLLDDQAKRWGMAHPYIEAVSTLLHERAPNQVSRLYEPVSVPPPSPVRRAPALLRELMPGTSAVEPTHLLSNGHYSVALRANGAGWSRRGALGITRTRDDALRDAQGSFFYLRMAERAQPVSITQHPAPDSTAWYRAVFHADRVCFDAAWPHVQAHATVWVSPEDDIEFRQIELRNLTDKPLELELISAFELTLADPRADEAHPAFSNLFIRAEWLASEQALLFERKPRLVTESGLLAAHFLAETDAQVTGIRQQTDRLRFWGRNHGAARPMATMDDLPASPTPGEPVTLDTGLDPVCALAVTLRIAPNAKAQLTFATAATDTAATLRAVIDKYRQPIHAQRASLMSATLTGIRLRSLGITAENVAAAQTLSTAVALTLTRPRVGPPRPESRPPDVCDRRLLWRFGISGDRPIVLVSAGLTQSLGLLRAMAQVLRLWAWGRVACDLIVIDAEPASYHMALHREITALRERHEAENGAQPGPACTGLHVLRADELSPEELGTLRSLARIRLRADGRPLAHHVQAWVDAHERAEDERSAVAIASVPMARLPTAPPAVTVGRFDNGSGEFRFEAGGGQRPPRPWINVLSNPAFGGQISEAGGGYTWAVNSRLNQLTAWSNDPVADPPSEWFLLQDRKSHQAWSVAPSAWSDERVTYHVQHGQGYSLIRHQRGDLSVTASWCVDAQTSVKQVWLRIENRGTRTQHLRLVGIAEWMMGASRSDRGTVHTAVHRASSAAGSGLALLATQADRSAGYGEGTAFLAMPFNGDAAASASEINDIDWTCDRRECFDARGRLVLPDHFGHQQGLGLDPCAALATALTLEPGATANQVFLIGYGANPDAARALAEQAMAVPPRERLDDALQRWRDLLGATQVSTPDPLFDAMVNRWLLYQSVACRMWAKAGFYQAGGATGFRDQLQDSMALAWAAPHMFREQIIVAASRQFPEGDVQHWWHAPNGAGVRTHFSDDLLWLPHACVHYLQSTGDTSLLDEAVHFLEGGPIPEGAEDAYYTPTISPQEASVYEHAARAIDRSLRSGEHGLPLMGTGDWNDGMNRVGHEGRGESVWLAWFLCRIVDDFSPIARQRGDAERAARWEAAAKGWRSALNTNAWDGQWYKRAFFDDGTPLGSRANREGRIDLIAQAWSVLARGEPMAMPRIAMTAAEELLVDPDAGLIKLLDPPLATATPSAGYIQAYPPGVRENGGQYSHAGVWALMAQAELASGPTGWQEAAELPYRYFCYLSPAHRAQHPVYGAAYAIEPYVMAGDVYTQPPYVGRGGWSWYTGAAAWLHRAAIGSILGVRVEAETLRVQPCLPAHWPQAEVTLRRDGRCMRFTLLRASPVAAREMAASRQARLLRIGESLAWRELPQDSHFIVPLVDLNEAPSPEEHSALHK